MSSENEVHSSTEAALAESRARLDAIVAASDDAIISKDLNGIIQTWNESAERIFGYTADEIVGQSITKLIPPERQSEEDYVLGELRQGRRVDHFRTVRIRKDGRRIDVSVTISPIHDITGRVIGALKVLRDLTANKELEVKFKAIVDSSDDAIISKDLNGIIRSWNIGAERIFGYTAEEMIGKPLTLLFPPDRLNEEPRILDRLRRGERVDHFETVRRRKDGSLIDVSVSISPIHGPGGIVIGASKIARDVTAIKRFMRERETLLESERAARREAERIGRMKDEFLTTLSHELRTPLNAILGWAQLLRTGAVDATDISGAYETIERNARLQAQLIEDLLDMGRIVSGKMRLEIQPIDPAKIIRQTVESAVPIADAKGIELHTDFDKRVTWLNADPARLQQIVWNLVSNAMKFTPSGGRVDVSLRKYSDRIELTVADTGAGISKEFLPYLFHRFAQADASSTRRYGGLGIGLAIVRHLVELHGGTVAATSAGEGRGSTFTVKLPISVEPHVTLHHDPQARTREIARPQPSPIDLSHLRVLVIDDEDDSRSLARRVLEMNGAEVIVASSAEEGMQRLIERRPDVVVSDIGMPDEDGYQFIRRVRALPVESGGRTMAVALTAFARPEDRNHALEAGYQDHVPKPMEPVELLTVVASLRDRVAQV